LSRISPSERWYLLIHSVPSHPLYLRAKVRRLLRSAGAAPIRKAVYAMPASTASLDRLRAVAAEIERGGGSAFLCEATFPDADVAASVVRAYNRELQARYRASTAALERALSTRGAARREQPTAAAARSEPSPRLDARVRSLEALLDLDRFSAPGSTQARDVLRRAKRSARPTGGAGLTGRRWVTRRGLHVDRLACAWVIRRFVDPRATFRFTSEPAAPLAAGEIGFDMPGAEIGHEAGGCSVETLIARARVRDPRVRFIADIVHDIDLEDGRHGHAETAGFEQLLVGLLASTPDDEDRLEHGLRLFDALHAARPGRSRPLVGGAMPRVRIPAGLRRRRPAR
jgi:hypothetical protein